MRRRNVKTTLKTVKVNKRRSNLRKKIKLQLWRKRFLLLHAVRIVKVLAMKRRKKLRLQKRAYRRIRHIAKNKKYRTIKIPSTRARRSKQLTEATLTARIFRKTQFSSLRRRARASRRRIRTLLRQRAFSRIDRSMFQRLRRRLRVTRRLYYLRKQRRCYRRINKKLAIQAARRSVHNTGTRNLAKKLYQARCLCVRRAKPTKRYFKRFHPAVRRRRLRCIRKVRARLIRRALRTTRIRTQRGSLLKNFRTWKLLLAKFWRTRHKIRRVRLRQRLAHKRLRKKLAKKVKKKLKKKKVKMKKKEEEQKEEEIKKTMASLKGAAKKSYEDGVAADRLVEWKRRGKFIRRKRRRAKRIAKFYLKKKQKNEMKLRLRTKMKSKIKARAKKRTRKRRAWVTRNLHRFRELARRRNLQLRRKVRSRYKIRRLRKQVRTYRRKIRALIKIFTPFYIRRSRCNVRQYQRRKPSKQKYKFLKFFVYRRKVAARKLAKKRVWLSEITRKAKTVAARINTRNPRVLNSGRNVTPRPRRKKLLAVSRAAICARIHLYQYHRQHLFARKLWSSVRHRTHRWYMRKAMVNRRFAYKTRKLQRRRRYVYNGKCFVRRVIRRYGPLKFLRWRRGPRRFISRKLRRSARLGYARAGAQFDRGLWTRRYRDRKYNKVAPPRKPVLRFRRRRKQKRRPLVSPRIFFLRRARYRYQLKRRKKISNRKVTKLLQARWVAKRRRPVHVSLRAALKAVRKSALKSTKHRRLRVAVSRRIYSRRISVYGRNYALTRRRSNSNIQFFYTSAVRFCLRRTICARFAYRTRTRRRRTRVRRRRYRMRKKRPGILYVAPAHSGHLFASTELFARRAHHDTFTTHDRQFLSSTHSSPLTRRIFSSELQKELFSVTRHVGRKKLRRTVIATKKLRRSTRGFLLKSRKKRFRLMLRKDDAGRGYYGYRSYSRYMLKFLKFTAFKKKRSRKTYRAKRIQKKRALLKKRVLLIARIMPWRKAFLEGSRKLVRSEIRAFRRKVRRACTAVEFSLAHENSLENALGPVLDWFDDEKNEKIYSNLEINSPKKEILVRGKTKKICT